MVGDGEDISQHLNGVDGVFCASFPLVVFLGGSSGNKLHGLWNGRGGVVIREDQVDMVAGDDIVQD